MRNRTLVAGIGAGVVIAAAASIAVPALAAPKSTSPTRTLTFQTSTNWQRQFGSSPYFAASDKDLNKAGVQVFADVISCKSANQTTGSCDAALTLENGILYAHFDENAKGDISGTVTGGTAAYLGDTGTVTGAPFNNSQTESTVTVKFHH